MITMPGPGVLVVAHAQVRVDATTCSFSYTCVFTTFLCGLNLAG